MKKKALSRGGVSIREFEVLYSISELRSVQLKKALVSHLVYGLTQEACGSKYNVHQGHISRGVKSLRNVYDAVAKINNL